MRLNKARLKQEVAKAAFEQNGTNVIIVADLYQILYNLQCSAGGFDDVDRCDNEARYDSGYCSIHDMLLNDNKGKRIPPTESAKARCRVCRSCEKEPGDFANHDGHCLMCVSSK